MPICDVSDNAENIYTLASEMQEYDSLRAKWANFSWYILNEKCYVNNICLVRNL